MSSGQMSMASYLDLLPCLSIMKLTKRKDVTAPIQLADGNPGRDWALLRTQKQITALLSDPSYPTSEQSYWPWCRISFLDDLSCQETVVLYRVQSQLGSASRSIDPNPACLDPDQKTITDQAQCTFAFNASTIQDAKETDTPSRILVAKLSVLPGFFPRLLEWDRYSDFICYLLPLPIPFREQNRLL